MGALIGLSITTFRRFQQTRLQPQYFPIEKYPAESSSFSRYNFNDEISRHSTTAASAIPTLPAQA